jgi:hypothetical protein
VINFKAKGTPCKKPARKKKAGVSRLQTDGLTRADIAEINLFSRVIAKMNAKAR